MLFSLAHKHKHKKNEHVCFSCAYAYAYALMLMHKWEQHKTTKWVCSSAYACHGCSHLLMLMLCLCLCLCLCASENQPLKSTRSLLFGTTSLSLKVKNSVETMIAKVRVFVSNISSPPLKWPYKRYGFSYFFAIYVGGLHICSTKIWKCIFTFIT